MNRRRWSARLAPLLLAMTCLVPPADLSARPQWLRATTEDVCILSDASPKAVKEYVVKYTAFRQAFIALLAPPGKRPPPVVLLLFRNDSELHEHLAKADGKINTVAFSAEVDSIALLALDASGDRENALSLAFEFDTIWSLRRVGYSLPLWMAQGTGEVFATLRISKDRCLIDGDLGRVASTWRYQQNLPWPRFFAINEASKEYKGREATGLYQAQAWALMNLILLQEDNPRARFDRLAGRILAATPDLQAVEAELGVPAKEFVTVIERQLRRNRLLTVPFDESGILARLKIEPADEAEVNVRRGDLLLANGRETEGDAAIDRAAASAPGAVCVNEALARRELRRNETAEAARFYRTAIAAGSVDANAFLASASDRLDQSRAFGSDFAGGGGKNVVVALGEIRRALELDPGNRQAWPLLGRAFFVAEHVTAEDIAELGPAVTDDLDGLQMRYARGLLYFRLNRKEEARADLDRVIGDERTPQTLRDASTSFKMQMQYDDDQPAIEELVRDQKYAEARAIAERGVGQATGTGAAAHYLQLRQWVDENDRWTQVVACYNRKDWPAAIKAAQAFVADFPRSSLCGRAQDLIAAASESNRH